MKIYKRITAVLLGILLILMLLPSAAAEVNEAVSLTVSCQDKGAPLVGARFSVYLAASADEYGRLTPTKDFAGYNVDFTSKELASTLEGYVLRDSIKPTDSASTDSSGNAIFPTGGRILSPGLYLVIADRHVQNGYSYEFTPFTLILGHYAEQEFNAVVNAKFSSELLPILPLTTTRKVLKIWDDDGHEDERPDEITVQLLRDGELYDTVVLSKDNNWRHTWTGLRYDSKWTVAEDELDGYTVSVSREGVTFVITNTYTELPPDEPEPPETTPPDETEPPETTPPDETEPPETTPPDETEPPETTPPDETEPPETTPPDETNPPETTPPDETNPPVTTPPDETEPPETSTPDTPDTTPPPLPQTGQLWWPVPVFVAVGLAFIIIGVICSRGIFSDEK